MSRHRPKRVFAGVMTPGQIPGIPCRKTVPERKWGWVAGTCPCCVWLGMPFSFRVYPGAIDAQRDGGSLRWSLVFLPKRGSKLFLPLLKLLHSLYGLIEHAACPWVALQKVWAGRAVFAPDSVNKFEPRYLRQIHHYIFDSTIDLWRPHFPRQPP